jgi:hypothetical protein
MWQSAKTFLSPVGVLAWVLTIVGWVVIAIAVAPDHPVSAGLVFGLSGMVLGLHAFWRYHKARTSPSPYFLAKEILGVYQEQGYELHARKLNLRGEDATAWGHRVYDFLRDAFGLSEAELFRSEMGLVTSGETSEMGWTRRRLMRLQDLITRADSLTLNRAYDFDAELRRVKEASNDSARCPSP